MNLLELDFEPISINARKLIGKPVCDDDFDYLIEDSSYVNLVGTKPVVYLNLNDSRFDELLPYLSEMKLAKSSRKTLGASNFSALFGAVTAKINRSDFCNVGVTASASPQLNRLLIEKFSTVAMQLMKLYLPQWQKVGQSVFKHSKIHSDWRMRETFWTSGIINKNSPHNYHLDGDNSKNVHSAMITFKGNMSGGYLVMPEYRIAFKVANRSLIYFCGKEIIHGVSPISLRTNGFRYSIVYYTTADLHFCESYEVEERKARKL